MCLLFAMYCCIYLAIVRLKYWSIEQDLVADNWAAFLLDQFLHLFVLAAAACVLARSLPAHLFLGLRPSPLLQAHILDAGIIYVAVVFGGGYLIRYLTQSFSSNEKVEDTTQLKKTGLYVG